MPFATFPKGEYKYDLKGGWIIKCECQRSCTVELWKSQPGFAFPDIGVLLGRKF